MCLQTLMESVCVQTDGECVCVFADSEVTLVWEKQPTADDTFLCSVSSDSDSERPDDFSAELHTLQHAQVRGLSEH